MSPELSELEMQIDYETELVGGDVSVSIVESGSQSPEVAAVENNAGPSLTLNEVPMTSDWPPPALIRDVISSPLPVELSAITAQPLLITRPMTVSSQAEQITAAAMKSGSNASLAHRTELRLAA